VDGEGASRVDLVEPERSWHGWLRSGWARFPGAPVPDVAFSRDLSRCVNIARREGLAVRDTRGGEPRSLGLAQPEAEPGDLNDLPQLSVALVASDTRALVGAYGAVRLVDLESGRELWKLPLEKRDVESVAMSRDGTLVACAMDHEARVYDVETRALRFRSRKHLNSVDEMRFTDDGARLITACSYANPNLFVIASGEQLLHLSLSYSAHFVVSPDGGRAASGMSEGPVVVWDTRTGAELQVLRGRGGFVNGVAFSADGRFVAAGGRSKLVEVWDTLEKKPRPRTFRGHTEAIESVGFSPDGRWLASCGADGLKLWDFRAHPTPQELSPRQGYVEDWAFLHDGRTLAIGGLDQTWHPDLQKNDDSGVVDLWDLGAGTLRTTLRQEKRVERIALTRDERLLATASVDGTVRLWDLPAGEHRRTLRTDRLRTDERAWEGGVAALALSPDGSRLVAGTWDGRLELWETASGACVREQSVRIDRIASETDRPLHHVDARWLEGGIFALSTYGVLRAHVWDGPLEKEIVHEDSTGGSLINFHRPFAVSEDGRLVAWGPGQTSRTATLWDVGERRARHRLGSYDEIQSLAFSRDGSLLAIAGQKGDATYDVALFSTADGRHLRDFRGHESTVTGLAFMPDGSRLVSGSYDRTVKLWDVESAQEVLSLPFGEEAGDRVYGVIVSPDGRWIAAHDQRRGIVWESP
jgi:WD40 repeat protein